MYSLWLAEPVSRGPKATIRWKSARTCAGVGSGIGRRAACADGLRAPASADALRAPASAEESPSAAAPSRSLRRVSVSSDALSWDDELGEPGMSTIRHYSSPTTQLQVAGRD